MPISLWVVNAGQELIAEIIIHGNRLIPADTIKARISIKPGDVYDPNNVERDFNSLWNTGYFQDVRFEREQSERGWIIQIYLKEKSVIVGCFDACSTAIYAVAR